jgi:hypothetical protein
MRRPRSRLYSRPTTKATPADVRLLSGISRECDLRHNPALGPLSRLRSGRVAGSGAAGIRRTRIQTDSVSSDILNRVTFRAAGLSHLPLETVQMIASFGLWSPVEALQRAGHAVAAGGSATRGSCWSRLPKSGPAAGDGVGTVERLPRAPDTPEPDGLGTALIWKERDADGS